MGSPTARPSQQQQDGLEDGEWRVPPSEEGKGTSTRDYYAHRGRSSSHQTSSGSLHRRYRDYHRGMSSGPYRDRETDQRRGPVSPPQGRPSSGPLRIGRRGPPLSARGSPSDVDVRGRAQPQTYSRPRFSMSPYYEQNHKDSGSRYSSYKASREFEFSPRSRHADGARESARTPFSGAEYQESMARKAATETEGRDQSKPKDVEKKSSLKRHGTVDILKSIKDLEDKKEGVVKEITEAETELSILKASLPKLVKALDKLSRKAPSAPKSPISLDISEEDLSMDESDSNDSFTEASRTKGHRSKQTKSKILQKNIEILAPEQRRLVSSLGKELQLEAEKGCQSSIKAQNVAMQYKVSQRFKRLHPEGYCDKENNVDIKSKLLNTFQMKQMAPTGVYNVLRKDHIAILKEHMLSGIRYRFAFEKWREDAIPISSPVYRTMVTSGIDPHANEPGSPLSRSMSRGRNRGVVRSDLEERIAIATMQAVESIKTMTTLPTQMVTTERSARWIQRYHDWNRLLKNPSKEFENDEIVRPWSKREKDIFAEKFLLYHKDFARIASYLPSRTIPEIIKFYYAVQRSQEFEVTRRKWQLRKRREKAEESALQRTGTVSSMGSLPGGAIGVAPPSNNTSNVTEGIARAMPTNANTQMEDTSAVQSGRKKKKTKRKKAVASLSKNPGNSEIHKIETYFASLPVFACKKSRQDRVPVDSSCLHTCIVYDIQRDPVYAGKLPSIALNAPHSFSTSNLEHMAEEGVEKTKKNAGKSKGDAKKKKARRSSADDGKSVGRGRLPSVDTDKKYIEAVEIYGKDFPRIASYMNKTVDAARKYWERHSKRLGLLALLQGDDNSPEGILEHSAWSDVLNSIQEDTFHALDEHALQSIPATQWEQAVSVLDFVPHNLDVHHISSVLIPELIEGTFERMDEITEFLKSVKDYFSLQNSSEKRKRQRDRPVWSDDEKTILIDAFKEHGKNWAKLQEALPSKSLTQVKNFYQNYREKYFNEATQEESKTSRDDKPSPTSLAKRPKLEDTNDSVPEINIPQEMLDSLPQSILDQMERVMTNPTARMQFNALVMMQQQDGASNAEQPGTTKSDETRENTDRATQDQ